MIIHTLEITIQHQPRESDSYPVVVEHTRPDSLLPIRTEGKLELSEEAHRQLKRLALNPKLYGQTLGELLFAQRRLADAFATARGASQGTMRILLSIEAPELRSLHWERLAVPLDDGRLDVLARNQNFPFALYLASGTGRHFPPIGQHDLRALVVVSNPLDIEGQGLAAFDDVAAVQNLKAALGPIPYDILANVSAIPEARAMPTLANLLTFIQATHYPLLHLMAHGQYIRSTRETNLYLTNDQNEAAVVTASRLVDLLARLSTLPHLAFLVTCDSGKLDPEAYVTAEIKHSLGGLGQSLVRELGLHAVVAMTDKITVSTATALAPKFYERLLEHGYPDLALVEAGANLIDRYDVEEFIVPILFSRLGGRPLFSDTPSRPLTDGEISIALTRLEQELFPMRAPILLDMVKQQISVLRRVSLTSLGSLSNDQRREWDAAWADVNSMCEEVIDLDFRALAFKRDPPAYDDRCPFPGLKAFQTDEQEFFFGREAWIEELHQRLEQTDFLAILGASGSGKSSLVLAGLVPTWQKATPNVKVVYMTPGHNPLATLNDLLDQAVNGPHSLETNDLSSSTSYSLSPLPSLLIVDQFEELFTLCFDDDQRYRFLDRLLHLIDSQSVIQNPNSKIQILKSKIVLTMRADFLGDCAPYPALRQIIQTNLALIPPMTTVELRSAMEQQAGAVGLRFEANLSHTILSAVQYEPGAMPLLQHLLREMWQRRHGRWLLGVEYEALGGIAQAVAHTADALYDQATPAEQIYLREIFIRLTRLGETIGSTQEYRDTRQRVSRADLILKPEDAPLVRSLLSHLADVRLVITRVPSWPALGETASDLPVEVDDHQVEVEVTHEALIHHWSRLQDWLRENRNIILMRSEISQAAKIWQASPGSDKEDLLLHRGGRLEDIDHWLSEGRLRLNSQEQAYVEACLARQATEIAKELEAARKLAEEAEARRKAEAYAREEALALAQERMRAAAHLRKRAIWLAGIGVVAVLAAIAASWFGWQSKQNADLAATRGAEAIANQNIAATRAAEAQANANLAATREMEAELNANLAATRAAEAQVNANLAATRAVEAQNNADLAAAQEAKAQQQARIALAGQLAAQSQAAPIEKPLLSLILAIEALNVLKPGDPHVSAPEQALRDALQKPIGHLLYGHQAAIRVSALSSDGRWFATGSDDNTVRLWSLGNLETEPRILPHNGWVSAVAFSADGVWLATASADHTARLWSVNEPDKPPISLKHEGAVNAVGFSPDGRWFATGSQDKIGQLWSMEALDDGPKILSGHLDSVSDVAFSPDGRWLATASHDDTVRLWSMKDLEAEPLVLQGHSVYETFSSNDYAISDMSLKRLVMTFSPDGRWLATGSDDNNAVLWSMTQPGAKPIVLSGHESRVHALAFSPDGRWLATISWDDTTRIWSVLEPETEPTILTNEEVMGHHVAFSPDGRWLATTGEDKVGLWSVTEPEIAPIIWRGHENRVSSVSFSPDGQWLLTTSWDKTARLWSIMRTDPEPGVIIDYGGRNIRDMAFSPDGRWLAIASNDELARLWPIKELEAVPVILPSHNDSVMDIAFSQDGTWLTTVSVSNTISLWSMVGPKAELVTTLNENGEGISAITFSPDGRWLATAGSDNPVLVWSVADLEASPIILDDAQEHVQDIGFSPDGRWLATVGLDKKARLWLITDRESKPKIVYDHEEWIHGVAFSPDGNWLATASGDGLVRLWSMVNTKTEPILLRGHQSAVEDIAFDPNGRWLATAGAIHSTAPNQSTAVLLWSVADLTSEPITIWRSGDIDVNTLIFSPDGRWLATASSDSKTRLWHIELAELKALACNLVGRNLTFDEWQQYLSNYDYPHTCSRFPIHPSVTSTTHSK